MKKVLLALLLSCLAIASVRADYIWYESFNYANGPIISYGTNTDGSTNWFRHSGSANPSDALVNNHKLEIGSTGGTSTRQDDIHRFLSTTNNSIYTNNATTMLYASFTVNFSQLPSSNGAYFASFYVSSSFFPGRLWALTGNPSGTNVFTGVPGTYRLGVSLGSLARPSVIYPVDLATNTDYQVVVELDQADQATYLWVNPLSAADCVVNSSDPIGTSGGNILAFAFRQASGFAPTATVNPILTVSNLAVATTFGEAATNVWPTTPVAPIFVFTPQNTTNYVGTTMSLSAVANGQSLCALTYQWYKGGSPVSGATSNVFTLPSAATGDSGQYTLTVSNPNTGLSATTTPVWLTVQNIPAPPQICGQPPATTTVTYGQTVTLSVCANGTPPITYSWYYNNTLIDPNVLTNDTLNPDGSLTIVNVRPGNNTVGTYYCHLVGFYTQFSTNSANAVVSANPPVVIKIGALRGMVDPVYYLPTNTTTYFQVTGTVISKTNYSTTVNGEYFIQDDTGGIAVYSYGAGGLVPNPGDNVTVTGPVGNYSSLMEIMPDVANPATGVVTNNPGSPLPLPPGKVLPCNFTNSVAFGGISNAFRLYQGSLLTFTNVSFPAALTNGTWVGGATYAMVDSSGAVIPVYIYSGFANLIGQPIPAFCYRVTAPMSFYLSTTAADRSAGYQFEPSMPEDFVTAPPLAVGVNVSVNGSGKPVLTWTAEPFMSYTVLRSATLSPNLADYHAVASGLTFNTTAGQYTDTSASGAAFYKVTSP